LLTCRTKLVLAPGPGAVDHLALAQSLAGSGKSLGTPSISASGPFCNVHFLLARFFYLLRRFPALHRNLPPVAVRLLPSHPSTRSICPARPTFLNSLEDEICVSDGVSDGALPRRAWLDTYFVEFPCC